MGAYITIVYPNHYIIKLENPIKKTVKSAEIITQLSNMDLLWGGATDLYGADLKIINECKSEEYYLGSDNTIKQIEAYLQRKSLLQNRVQISKQFDEKEEEEFKNHKKSCPKLENKTIKFRNKRLITTSNKSSKKYITNECLPRTPPKQYRIRKNSNTNFSNNYLSKDLNFQKPEFRPFPSNQSILQNRFQIQYFLDDTLLTEQTQKEGEPISHSILQMYDLYENKEMTIKYETHKIVMGNMRLFCRNKRKGDPLKDQNQTEIKTINSQSYQSHKNREKRPKRKLSIRFKKQ